MYTSSWGGIMKKKTNKNDTRFQEPIPYQEPMFLTIVREGVWTIRAKPIIGDHNTSFGTRVADSFLFFFVFVFVSFSIMRSFPLTLLGVVLCCVVLGGVAGEASYWDFWSNGVRDSSGCNYGPFLNQWCPNHVGEHTITVDYVGCGACNLNLASGEATFGQPFLYGTFAMKARFVKLNGLVQTIFLWNDSPGNTGEIDLEVLPGGYINNGYGFQTNVCPCGGGCSTNNCQHQRQIGTNDIFDNNMHVMGAWWTPNWVAFYYDGRVVTNYTSYDQIPHNSMSIKVSAWPCSTTNWCGAWNGGGLPTNFYVDYVYFNPDGGAPPAK